MINTWYHLIMIQEEPIESKSSLMKFKEVKEALEFFSNFIGNNTIYHKLYLNPKTENIHYEYAYDSEIIYRGYIVIEKNQVEELYGIDIVKLDYLKLDKE